MKVDIYQLRGQLKYLIVEAGTDTEEVIRLSGIDRALNQFSSSIEIPNAPGGMAGIDGPAVHRDINKQGWSLQIIKLGQQ